MEISGEAVGGEHTVLMINRRRPFILRYRVAQIVGVPTSQVKIASGAATSSIVFATN